MTEEALNFGNQAFHNLIARPDVHLAAIRMPTPSVRLGSPISVGSVVRRAAALIQQQQDNSISSSWFV